MPHSDQVTLLSRLFVHGLYHRGQPANTLRQSAIEKIQPADFIAGEARSKIAPENCAGRFAQQFPTFI